MVVMDQVFFGLRCPFDNGHSLLTKHNYLGSRVFACRRLASALISPISANRPGSLSNPICQRRRTPRYSQTGRFRGG